MVPLMLDTLGWGAFALRLLVAAILIAYGAAKIRDGGAFIAAVRRHRLGPDRLAVVAARLLPPFEVALGVAFLTGVAIAATGFVIAALLALFTALLLRARRTPAIATDSCGCGASATPSVAITRNALLLAATGFAVLGDRVFVAPPTLAHLALAAAAVALVIARVVIARGRARALARCLQRLQERAAARAVAPVEGPALRRRAFVRLGAGAALGALALLASGPPAHASGCNCTCYPDCYYVDLCAEDCCGCAPGTCYGRYFYRCDYNCCPPEPPIYCDSSFQYIGTVRC